MELTLEDYLYIGTLLWREYGNENEKLKKVLSEKNDGSADWTQFHNERMNNQSQAAENAHALYMRYKNTHLGFLKEMLR